MPNTPNPLLNMTDAIDHDRIQQERPDNSFVKTALPGFKQTLQARRAIRE